MRGELYQISLVALGAIATALFGVFLYREVFPEYKIYQNDYIALEKFRSTYTAEPPPVFSEGVKQIVILAKDNGPPIIDRCVSCHVALQLPAFSPTKIEKDINGQVLLDQKGTPVQIPNEEYVWTKLDQKVADLTDEKKNEQLKVEGKWGEVKARLQQAAELNSLKIAQVGEHTFDVTKVLRMHPLIGKETRPFEFHPLEEYGCVSCHNGNGRGLTTEKAHGPVFDEEYEPSDEGPVRKFLESDPKNDPPFAYIFNSKPGETLIFQTTPIFVGPLMEAKCAQCHLTSPAELQGSLNTTEMVAKHRIRNSNAVKKAFENQKHALASLLVIKNYLVKNGPTETIAFWEKTVQDYSLPPHVHDAAEVQLDFLRRAAGDNKQNLLDIINKKIDAMIGSPQLSKKLEELSSSYTTLDSLEPIIDKFIQENRLDPTASGSLFQIATEWNLDQEIMQHVRDTATSLKQTVSDQQFLTSVKSDIDLLMNNYHHGENLYISQACYACHKIDAFAHGGVGPDLTHIGNYYPWYIKHHIVCPQCDTPTSTMPNFRLDHDELEDLVTFLLGQTGETKAQSGANYKAIVQEWEAGRKLPWEEPISPSQMHDLRFSMTVFATQGCAACHRLKGFESNVGFKIQQNSDKVDFDTLYNERQWFKNLFPEAIIGSDIVKAIENNSSDIDQRIVDNVHQGSILEEIEKTHPGHVEALYSNFKFASRAKNHYYEQLAAEEKDPTKKTKILEEKTQWQTRVNRILMMFIQEYGLGRLIGPRPNWSGVYRSDEWLMEHFRNPSSHVPNSIMPIFPFDETKFYALTYMLDTLGIRNRNEVRDIWRHQGFSPAIAAHILCSQCHGEFLLGNGPVAEWIYPIPKNLRNPDFLRNMTKERIIQSITHGVKGTPMPPWGEVGTDKPSADGMPVLNKQEIAELTNWLFSSLPGGEVIKESKDVPKWEYSPKDVLLELRNKATLEDVFEINPPPVPGPDSHGYYISRKFYTPENIAAGREFFIINCAVCHGQEADGTGIRAEIMQEAKPRMLTNLDWQNTHDDLYMLRSIKYGVPGTSMTPWGDFTSALQRLQLVAFIRSLTQETQRREKLVSALYQSFEAQQNSIELARINQYANLDSLQKEYNEAKDAVTEIRKNILAGKAQPKDATSLLEKEFNLLTQLQHKQQADQLFVNLKMDLEKEESLYNEIGKALILRNIEDNTFQTFIQLINETNHDRFSLKDNQLHFTSTNENAITQLGQEIISNIDEKIILLKKEKAIEDGKIPSIDISKHIAHLSSEIQEYSKLKNVIISNLHEATRTRENQIKLYKELQNNIEKPKE